MNARQIKALRKKMGLSMEAFAHEVGTTSSSIYRWERGEQEPRKMAQKLLDLLKGKVDAGEWESP